MIFIPQGSLFLVPFPALMDEKEQYLIQKHTILTAPSIQVLELTAQRQQQLSQTSQNQEILVVGNPKMPSISKKLGGKPEALKSLPWSEKEAHAIAKLLKTKPLIGPEATESTITRKLQKSKIVHLATHGLLDELKHLGLGAPGAIARS